MSPPQPNAARFEQTMPRLFGTGALLTVCAYGLLLMTPVIISFLVVSVLGFGIWTLLIPFLTLALVTLFLPFGFGNTYIRRLARPLQPPERAGQESFLVQVTLCPRLHSGPRALIEDADDIGWLSVSETSISFQGDALRFLIPLPQIRDVEVQSIGLRGLFLYPRLALTISDLPEMKALAVAERSSAFLPNSHRASWHLYNCLTQKVTGAVGLTHARTPENQPKRA
jgi:hypothetical protein